MRRSYRKLGLALAAGLVAATTISAGPASAADTFAAVAISPASLDTGIAWSAGTQAEAEKFAIQYCAKQGNNKDCKSVLWGEDTCVAIAVSHGTGHNDGTWGFSWNNNRSVAGTQAVALCTTATNKDCKVQQSACSYDP